MEVEVDQIPVFELNDILAPVVDKAPLSIAAVVFVLSIGGIIWLLGFMWERHKRHNR